MTLSPWIIYLWGIADNLNATAVLFSILTGAAFLILLIVRIVHASVKEPDDKQRKSEHWKDEQLCKDYVAAQAVLAHTKTPFRVVAPLFIVAVLTATLAPSSRTIAVMVVAPAIVNSEPIQKDLPELYKAAKDALMHTLTDK